MVKFKRVQCCSESFGLVDKVGTERSTKSDALIGGDKSPGEGLVISTSTIESPCGSVRSTSPHRKDLHDQPGLMVHLMEYNHNHP